MVIDVIAAQKPPCRLVIIVLGVIVVAVVAMVAVIVGVVVVAFGVLFFPVSFGGRCLCSSPCRACHISMQFLSMCYVCVHVAQGGSTAAIFTLQASCRHFNTSTAFA